MGLLTNRCTNPECGHRVRRGSQFCPVCGSAGPKGLTTCGACGAEVRRTSKYCPQCGGDLAQVAKPTVLRQRWARRHDDVAVRVDNQDVKGCLTKPLNVEHGTKALLFQKGAFKGGIGPGRYDMGGFLNRLNHFMVDQATNVVLVEDGDIVLDIENGDLWTANEVEVGTVERIVLRVRHPEAMCVNLFKGRSRVTVSDLEESLAGEVQMLLSGIVAEHDAETLFTDLEVRNQIEQRLREAIKTTIEHLGLELVQLRFIRFWGEAYETLRRERADLRNEEQKAEIAIQRTRLGQRLRESLTQDIMDAHKNEKDFEDFVRQTEHEMGLKEVIREDEMERLKERFRFERDHGALLRRIEIETITDDAQREKAWKDLIAEERERDEQQRRDLQRRKEEAESGAEKRKIELELQRLENIEDIRQAEEGLSLLGRVKDMEHQEAVREQELEAKTLQDRGKATAEALLSILDGPEADRIAGLEKLRARQDMSPDQILALAAEASPEAARALAKKYETEGQLAAERIRQLEQQLASERAVAKDHADRLERLSRFAMEQMGGVATSRARPVDPKQTVVAGGGMGRPVVVNMQTGQPQRACRKCGATLEGDQAYCPACGRKQ